MEGIAGLKTQYCEWLDGKQWDRWASLFTEAPGRVRVVWHMNDRVETPPYVLEGAGFYEDRYVRADDGWKIAGVRLHGSGVELRPKSLVGEALHVGLAPGQRP